MIYLNWFVLALLSIFTSILGVFLVPIGLLFAGAGRLPWWLQWFDNDREPFGDTARRPAIEAATGIRRAWLRYWWLAIRNPGNNFGYLPGVGFAQTSDVWYLQHGNPNTSDQGEAGWKYVEARSGPALALVAFELYIVAPWSATRCLRVRLGWKIDHNMIAALHRTDGSITQLVAVVNPFDTFGAP